MMEVLTLIEHNFWLTVAFNITLHHQKAYILLYLNPLKPQFSFFQDVGIYITNVVPQSII